jgi:hypothetical protein
MECIEQECGDASPLVLRVQSTPSSSAMKLFTYTLCDAAVRRGDVLSRALLAFMLTKNMHLPYRNLAVGEEDHRLLPIFICVLLVDRCMHSLVHMSRGSCSIHAPNKKALQGALIVNSEFRVKCSVETTAPRAFQGAFV